MQVSGWDSYKSFWILINYPCLNSFVAALALISEFSFTVIGLVFFALISFIISALFAKFKREDPSVFIIMQKCCIEFICNIYYVPCAISLIMLIKYSSQEYDYLEEYSANIPGNVLNYGSIGAALGVSALILHILLAMIYESCAHDMAYSLENNFYCQSQPYVGIYLKGFLFAQCVMVESFQLEYYEFLLKIDVFLYLITSIIILYFVPYHCLFTNTVKFLVYADSTLICTAFLLGLLNNSSTLTFVLAIILQPFLIYLSYELVKYRISKFKAFENETSTSFPIFEHSARSHLINGDKDIKILNELNKQSHFNLNSFFTVLCANYCLETLQNSKLAQIKIERVKTINLYLPVMFSIYKCKDTLRRLHDVQLGGLKWVIFYQDLDAALKTDQEVCDSLLVMYNKLLEPNQKLHELKQLVLRSHDLIETTMKTYLNLLKQFPGCRLVRELYGLFLRDLLNKFEHGSAYLIKENNGGNANCFARRSKFQRKDDYIFIISGNPGIQGKFLYASEGALEFLKISKSSLINTYIFDFLPSPFQNLHRKYLVNFADKCVTHTIPCNVFPYLLINGYLVECTSSTECVVYDQNTYFVTFLDPLGDLGREVVLVDLSGLIISHSAGLSSLFEIQIAHIEGRHINEYLPIQFSDLLPDTPTKLIINLGVLMGEKIVAAFLESNKFSKAYLTLYLTTEENEISQWCDRESDLHEILGEDRDLSLMSVKRASLSFNSAVAEEQNMESKIVQSANESYSSSLESIIQDKSLIISLRSLSVIRILVIVSVRNIQKLALITTIIAIAIFLYETSLRLSDLSIAQSLGEVNHSLLVIAIFARSFDVNALANAPLSAPLSLLQPYILNVQEYYSQIVNNTGNWPNCQASEIVAENVLPNWRLVNGEPLLYFSNLQDYIGEIIRAVTHI